MGWIDQFREFGRFSLRALRIAFTGKFWFAEKLAGGVMLLAAILAVFFRELEAAMMWLPVAVFFAVFLGTVTFGFLYGCYTLYSEQKSRAETAEAEVADLKTSRWVSFAIAARDAMSEDRNFRMAYLSRKRRDKLASPEEEHELKTLSSFRCGLVRDRLEMAKLVGKGRHPDGSTLTISAEFWKGARMNFGDGWAESDGLRYTEIEIAVLATDRSLPSSE